MMDDPVIPEIANIDGQIIAYKTLLDAFAKKPGSNLDLIRKPVGTMTAMIEDLQNRKEHIKHDIHKA